MHFERESPREKQERTLCTLPLPNVLVCRVGRPWVQTIICGGRAYVCADISYASEVYVRGGHLAPVALLLANSWFLNGASYHTT